MMHTLTRFSACCRAWDLRVSTSEVLDCFEQLSMVDTTDKAQFRMVAKANFAKSRREQKKFDQVFDLFFDHIPIPQHRSLKPELARSIERVADQLKDTPPVDPFDQALVDFLTKSPANFLKTVRQAQTAAEPEARVLKSNLSQLSGKLEMMLKINAMEKRVLAAINADDSMSGPENQAVRNHFSTALKTARHLLTREPGYNN